jgi:phosphoserine phosphatase
MRERSVFLFSDVDGTLMRWQLFYYLIAGMVEHGLFPRVVLTRASAALEAYRNREGSFRTFIDHALRAYQDEQRMKGIRVSDVCFVANEVMDLYHKQVHVFTRELLHVAKEHGFKTAFISGSPTEAVECLAMRYDVDVCIGTDHPHENGFYTGGQPKE